MKRWTHYKRHHDDEIVDEIRITTIPRYKTSGLSGDEWRTSVRVELWRKKQVMVSKTYTSQRFAIAHLPWLLATWTETAGEEWTQRIADDKKTCHQPGCSAPATVQYRLKSEFSREGFKDPLDDDTRDLRRAFCDAHKERGDCGLEDADRNYEVVAQR